MLTMGEGFPLQSVFNTKIHKANLAIFVSTPPWLTFW